MKDYPITPVPFTAVTVEDEFWSPRLESNRRVTIPYDFRKCEETGRVDNFLKAAGVMEGDFTGHFPFNDSDLFKIIEGAAFSLSTHPDPELDSYLDELIAKIGAAQEADGYLYTARTIPERNGTLDQLRDDWEGPSRWSHLRMGHELYNLGHLYEAAAAHYQATGKRSLLEIALKSADLIVATFGPDKRRDVPGHQEVELGLVKLYRVTGEQKYLDLAKFFLDERGHYHNRERYMSSDNPGYAQDHLPVIEQAEAVGHAVRAAYMYSAMADVAALTDDQDYIDALDRLWRNVVQRKLYLTGGIGARHKGEAFGDDYELPNATAYAETCAAIAAIFWNQRMFLLHGDAKYIDVLERTLYNGFLSGIGRDGTSFFYANPLASDGEFLFNTNKAATRMPWFDCSCCPTNVVRLLASLPGYIYAIRRDRLYVNLFVASNTQLSISEMGRRDVMVELAQSTDYPWDGAVDIAVNPAHPATFSLCLRLPGWSQGSPVPGDLYRYINDSAPEIDLLVNGEVVDFELEQGYVVITRRWSPGDQVEFLLSMQVRRVPSNPAVRENAEHMALEFGPLVYCVESADTGGTLSGVTAPDGAVDFEWQGDVADGVIGLEWTTPGGTATAIPYYAWSERGPGEMAVWLPREEASGRGRR
ncbi:MAG: glycoside hydrolase family 127 protein [Caldilineaceae bacterium]|nr:glycoside hydrolase family 127 protein [Caldilineaceae bacterium]